MNPETFEVNRPAKPPKALLATVMLLWLAGLIAFGQWLLDRTNLDWTLAAMQHPKVLYPPDVEVFDDDGRPVTGLDRQTMWDAARKTDDARGRAMNIQGGTVAWTVAAMAVAAFVCGFVAWAKINGKWCSPLLAGMASVGVWALFLTCAALMLAGTFYKMTSRPSDFEGNTGHAIGRYIVIGIFIAGYCAWAWFVLYPRYKGLRLPKEGMEEIQTPPGWKVALTAVPVGSVAVMALFFLWLNGVDKDQDLVEAEQKKQMAAMGAADKEEMIKSGKVKFMSREDAERHRFFKYGPPLPRGPSPGDEIIRYYLDGPRRR